MTTFPEATVEEAALAWLESTGWQVAHGPDIAPDMPLVDDTIRGAHPVSVRISNIAVSIRYRTADFIVSPFFGWG